MKFELSRPKALDAIAQSTRLWKLSGTNEKELDKACIYLDSQLGKGPLGFAKGNFAYEMLSRVRYGDWVSSSWPNLFYIHSSLLSFGEEKSIEELF
jgi:hypothetical protein